MSWHKFCAINKLRFVRYGFVIASPFLSILLASFVNATERCDIFYRRIWVSGGIFWLSGGGWTFFIGECWWVGVGGGIFWVGGMSGDEWRWLGVITRFSITRLFVYSGSSLGFRYGLYVLLIKWNVLLRNFTTRIFVSIVMEINNFFPFSLRRRTKITSQNSLILISI